MNHGKQEADKQHEGRLLEESYFTTKFTFLEVEKVVEYSLPSYPLLMP